MINYNENKLKELQNKFLKLKKSNSSLNKKINDLNKNNIRLENENKELKLKNKNELEYLYSKVSSLTRSLENKELINKKLNRQLSSASVTLSMNQNRINNLTKKTTKLEEFKDFYSKEVVDKELENLHLTVSQLRNDLEQKDKLIRSLNMEIYDLKHNKPNEIIENIKPSIKVGALVREGINATFYSFDGKEYIIKNFKRVYKQRKIICTAKVLGDELLSIESYYPDVNNKDHFIAKYGNITRHKFVKSNKNKSVKISNNKFPKNLYKGESILICGISLSNKFIDNIKGLNIKLYWFDSYNDGYGELTRLINKVDYVLNITGNSRHYVDTIIRKSNKYLEGSIKYIKKYKLTYSNVVDILNELLGY